MARLPPRLLNVKDEYPAAIRTNSIVEETKSSSRVDYQREDANQH